MLWGIPLAILAQGGYQFFFWDLKGEGKRGLLERTSSRCFPLLFLSFGHVGIGAVTMANLTLRPGAVSVGTIVDVVFPYPLGSGLGRSGVL